MELTLFQSAKKLRKFYSFIKDAPIFQEEFGFYSLDRWISEGHITKDSNLDEMFMFDTKAKLSLGEIGWCEAAFIPSFEIKVLEDRGEYELVQDFAGRGVLYFKGRRDGFMPQYVDHPVKDMKSWEENVKWRLNFDAPGRFDTLKQRMGLAIGQEKQGAVICQNVIGGYMYLRSLMGPEELLFKFYDEPELIHNCMETWLDLADKIATEHQKHVSFDEVFLAEDICYNHGSLISPLMIEEFLLPYYEQLITNICSRQIDKSRHLFIQIDTDGNALPVIGIYKKIGMDYMSPFEVASGCDVVEVRKKYPDLLLRGGFDKRIIAQGKDAIDKEINRIMPFMKKYGGYIPTCDHGVPEEVSFENYMHFRTRMKEYSK